MNFRLYRQTAAENIQLQALPFSSELKMEAFVIENPNVLSSDEYANIEVLTDQLPLPEGRKSKNTDGRIDLLLDLNSDYLAIVELKKGTIGSLHVEQLKDYVEEATKNREKFLQVLGSENDYSTHRILGLIVGSDITPDLKDSLIKGLAHNDACILGITLNRYATPDRKEVYTLSEIFAPTKSAITRIRYTTWKEFSEQLQKRGIQSSIITLAKSVIDDIVKSLGLSNDSVVYAPNTFTLNIPQQKRRTVFTYAQIQKKAIKIFLSDKDGIPEGGTIHPDPERYPNLYFITLRDQDELKPTFLEMVRRSYEFISAQ